MRDEDAPLAFDAKLVAALIVSVAVGAVANAAGVGGGAIYIPLFNGLLGFGVKASTALSQACITAGALVQVALNVRRRHPLQPQLPLIDYVMALALVPALLVGVGIGVLLNTVLPSLIITALLMALLGLMALQMYFKGRSLWRAETQAAAEAEWAAAAAQRGATVLLEHSDGEAEEPLVPMCEAQLRRMAPDGFASLACMEGSGAAGTAGEPLPKQQVQPQRQRSRLLAPAGAARRPAATAASDDESWGCMEGVEPQPPQPAAARRPSSSSVGSSGVHEPLGHLAVNIPAASPAPGARGSSSRPIPSPFSTRGAPAHAGSMTRRESASSSSAFNLMTGASWLAFNELGIGLEHLEEPDRQLLQQRPAGGDEQAGGDGSGRPAWGRAASFDGGAGGSWMRRAPTAPAAGGALDAAPSPAKGGGGSGGGSWFERRSKWRQRALHKGALPHTTAPVPRWRGGGDLSAPLLQPADRAGGPSDANRTQRPAGPDGGGRPSGTGFLVSGAVLEPVQEDALEGRRSMGGRGSRGGSGGGAGTSGGGGGGGGADSGIGGGGGISITPLPVLQSAGLEVAATPPQVGAADPTADALMAVARQARRLTHVSSVPSDMGAPGPIAAAAVAASGGDASWFERRSKWRQRTAHAGLLPHAMPGSRWMAGTGDLSTPLLQPGDRTGGPSSSSEAPSLHWLLASLQQQHQEQQQQQAGARRSGTGAAAGGSGQASSTQAKAAPGAPLEPVQEDALEGRTSVVGSGVGSGGAALLGSVSPVLAGQQLAEPPAASAWAAAEPAAAADEGSQVAGSRAEALPPAVGSIGGAAAQEAKGDEGASPAAAAALAAARAGSERNAGTGIGPREEEQPKLEQQEEEEQAARMTNPELISAAPEGPPTPPPECGARVPPVASFAESPALLLRNGPDSASPAQAGAAEVDAAQEGGDAETLEARAARRAAARRTPLRLAGLLVAVWGVYLGLQVVRSQVLRCSPGWWAAFALQVCSMLGVSAAVVGVLAWRSRVARFRVSMTSSDLEASKHGAGSEQQQGSVQAAQGRPEPPAGGGQQHQQQGGNGAAASSSGSASLVLEAPLRTLGWTFCAGLAGGLLGLGGGMVMGPLMLSLGVHPQVSAATSGTMVLFSSSAALLQFALLGRINAPYALVFGAASALASVIGVFGVARAVRRSGRPSLVVFALLVVMVTGLVFVGIFGLRASIYEVMRMGLQFKGICGPR